MKSGLTFILLLSTLFFVQAQTPVQQLINQKFSPTSESISPFTVKSNSAKSSIISPSVLEDFTILQLNTAKSGQLINGTAPSLEMTLPIGNGRTVDLELITSPFDPNSAKVYASSDRSKYLKLNHGKHYWGRIKGDPTSGVALSIYNGEITGTINSAHESYSLVKLKNKTDHIIYQEKNLKDKPTFACFSDQIEGLSPAPKSTNTAKVANPDNAVGMYLEIDNEIYNDFGSMAATTNYINAVMNQVAILYANENINFGVTEMVVWDTTDPYTGPSSGNYLTQFKNRIAANDFNGDLAHLIGYGGGGGIAYQGVLCMQGNNRQFAIGYSGISNTFANVPTYSWTVNVLTHEIGHNLGSPHTHDCAWNGNNTAIDGCGSQAGAGGCSGPIPSNGGTIMSYCHLTNVGINLNNGFGTQPGDLIRNAVYNASCLTPSNGPTCTDGIQNGNETGVDCGGTCAPCDEEPTDPNCTAVAVTINFDNYPEETSWTIKTDAGATVASGGTYANRPDGSTLTIDECLSEGCYVFTINDSYGDGICCTYGNGSFSVRVDGELVASGAGFAFSLANSFCIDGGGDQPTCTDGIQNGNETGVDCGGADCAPCETCSDGIQNGNETGVDCGGPDCDACPVESTCDDGIQNGNETGVDCGGPDCAPCETCTDGIQNGNETGVDCGGSECSPCETCNDGIQNGNETGVDCGGPDCDACPVDPTCDDGVQNGSETGVDCGGTCAPCETGGCTDVEVSIRLDNYPEETSWTIKTQNGTTVASGGTYGNRPDGSTVNISECLEDGCYVFSIRDSYGDGICCSYGNGEYSVSVDGQVIVIGASFGSSESTEFCVENDGGGGEEPDPTCTDGIQNGNETGIDCGGPCAACPVEPTCTDGIQNGNETGVDCGGSCAPCATCNDGIQNGSETGIDCGGPDCSPCETAVCSDVVVEIKLDNYPQETSWRIAHSNGTIVAAGGTYGNVPNGSTISITECLNDGCYTFQILDSYGDGLCCSYGQGRYSVTVNDTEVASGSRFGVSESTGFCIGGTTSLPQTGSILTTSPRTDEINISPNPASNDITIDYKLKKDIGSRILIYDLTGRVIFESPFEFRDKGAYSEPVNTSEYQEGLYHAVVITEEGTLTKKFVIVR